MTNSLFTKTKTIKKRIMQLFRDHNESSLQKIEDKSENNEYMNFMNNLKNLAESESPAAVSFLEKIDIDDIRKVLTGKLPKVTLTDTYNFARDIMNSEFQFLHNESNTINQQITSRITSIVFDDNLTIRIYLYYSHKNKESKGVYLDMKIGNSICKTSVFSLEEDKYDKNEPIINLLQKEFNKINKDTCKIEIFRKDDDKNSVKLTYKKTHNLLKICNEFMMNTEDILVLKKARELKEMAEQMKRAAELTTGGKVFSNKPHKNSFESKTVKQLKSCAIERKIKGYSMMCKAELIEALRKHPK
jgi:hypothetical protein